jgi:hypothetical protein
MPFAFQIVLRWIEPPRIVPRQAAPEYFVAYSLNVVEGWTGFAADPVCNGAARCTDKIAKLDLRTTQYALLRKFDTVHGVLLSVQNQRVMLYRLYIKKPQVYVCGC